ncbi:MAG: tol-pal system-associated acyl-CoA thioesterase [Thiotrichales bacterium]|nr:tol-pal system-associated acyl-CoA thioesterase [Thiotrichales bacterium]
MTRLTQMNDFSWTTRIYYEDTDAGGVVYYTNYLKYMERARTELLRSQGYQQSRLIEQQNLIFAVRHVEVDYLKPARLDDELSVSADIIEINPASFRFHQVIKNQGDIVLCAGRILIVCLEPITFKPKRLPDFIVAELPDVN